MTERDKMKDRIKELEKEIKSLKDKQKQDPFQEIRELQKTMLENHKDLMKHFHPSTQMFDPPEKRMDAMSFWQKSVESALHEHNRVVKALKKNYSLFDPNYLCDFRRIADVQRAFNRYYRDDDGKVNDYYRAVENLARATAAVISMPDVLDDDEGGIDQDEVIKYLKRSYIKAYEEWHRLVTFSDE